MGEQERPTPPVLAVVIVMAANALLGALLAYLEAQDAQTVAATAQAPFRAPSCPVSHR